MLLRLSVLSLLTTISITSIANTTLLDNENTGSTWSGYVSGTYLSNAYQSDSAKNQQTATLRTSINYKLGDGHKINFRAGANQLINRPAGSTAEATTFRDSSIAHVVSGLTGDSAIKMNLRTDLMIPTAKTTRKKNQYTSLSITPTLYMSPFDNATIYYIPSLTRNIYESKNPVNGGANFIEWEVLNYFSLYYSLSDKFAVTATTYFVSQKPFDKSWRALQFSNGLSLDYSVAKKSTFTLGYSNSGSFLQPEKGPDQTYDLYDRDGATFYLTFTQSF